MNKLKAIDLNTESLKLYTTVAVASIAGLVAFHNSQNIEHCESAFIITLILFIFSAIVSIVTLNYYIIAVNNNEFEVTAKFPVWLNRIAVILFLIGLISAGFYINLSQKKISPKNEQQINGIIIQGNTVRIGNNVKTKIKITKDSTGNIKEILIPTE
ncbi:RNA-dependent RNA polymerase family protein [Flavobacterium collinsii]|jgi:lysylphosphatidylglycerol synthetase-like protein (DUF2156 family)|uniref:Uncharacterized protein n=1 Tax=Flavobacterium collinsii TaxID=1114861 RepID=A0A9W4TGY0_9FLAO|nr:hypothetical protein [Flavobacterium collinsii]CAI2767340.1 conserved membrane protein of unknown function [Flavobacterium collinsii]